LCKAHIPAKPTFPPFKELYHTLLWSGITKLRTHLLALEDKFDDIKKLIDTGKEKGYLTYDQVQ